MSETMIERVARAIDPPAFDADYQKWFLSKAWQDERAERARRNARAAIKEMREPTIYVMNTGGQKAPDGPFQALEIWQDMIDAALEGK